MWKSNFGRPTPSKLRAFRSCVGSMALQAHEVARTTQAWENGRVFDNQGPRGANDWFERSVVEPDAMLQDLALAFYPDDGPTATFSRKWLRDVRAGEPIGGVADEDLDAACPDIDAPYEFSSTEMCAQISTDDPEQPPTSRTPRPARCSPRRRSWPPSCSRTTRAAGPAPARPSPGPRAHFHHADEAAIRSPSLFVSACNSTFTFLVSHHYSTGLATRISRHIVSFQVVSSALAKRSLATSPPGLAEPHAKRSFVLVGDMQPLARARVSAAALGRVAGAEADAETVLRTYEHVVFQISHAKVATRVVADAVDAGEAAAVETNDGDVAAAAFCMQAVARGLRRRAVEDVFGRWWRRVACIAAAGIDGVRLRLLLVLWPQALQQIDACHKSLLPAGCHYSLSAVIDPKRWCKDGAKLNVYCWLALG